MKKIFLFNFVSLFLLISCLYTPKDTKEFKEIILLEFSPASITINQAEKAIDYQVMFTSGTFPSEINLLNFFSENHQSLFKLAKNHNLMQTSVNFGVVGEGFSYRMDCINQGIGLCDIGKGDLPNFTLLKSECLIECGSNTSRKSLQSDAQKSLTPLS